MKVAKAEVFKGVAHGFDVTVLWARPSFVIGIPCTVVRLEIPGRMPETLEKFGHPDTVEMTDTTLTQKLNTVLLQMDDTLVVLLRSGTASIPTRWDYT